MNLNLRKAIISNMNGNNDEQIRSTILDAIESGEEKMLPGLGVLFELAWKNAEPSEQEELIQHIEKELSQPEQAPEQPEQ